MLIPDGCTPLKVLISGDPVEFSDETVGGSHYAVVEQLPAGSIAEIQYQ